MTVCVIGSFMMDLVVTVKRRPNPGETLIGDTFSMHVGGKGFNQAVAARRAGSNVTMIGRLGTDPFAEKFITFMEEEKIDYTGVEYDEKTGTGTATPLIEENGQNSIVIVPQANMNVDEKQIDRHVDKIKNSEVVVMQLEIPIETVKYVAKIVKNNNKTLVLNPAPYTKLDDELLKLVDYLIPNETELLGLIPNCDINSIESIVENIKTFQKNIPLNFVVTLGERGVVSVDKNGEVLTVEPHLVTPIDTVGAGDTFCGYFSSAIAEGKPLLEAIKLANKAASISVTRRGAAQSVPQNNEINNY